MDTESKLAKARIALIEAIQKLGSSYQAAAESAAMSAARKLSDKDAASYARESVLRHDERRWMADEAIKLIWKHWPKEST